jgi:hypothetical protein
MRHRSGSVTCTGLKYFPPLARRTFLGSAPGETGRSAVGLFQGRSSQADGRSRAKNCLVR